MPQFTDGIAVLRVCNQCDSIRVTQDHLRRRKVHCPVCRADTEHGWVTPQASTTKSGTGIFIKLFFTRRPDAPNR